MSNLSELLPAGAGAKSAKFVASGTLASGQAIGLKTDGTVSAISPSFGTPTVVNSSTVNIVRSTYDPDSGKVIIIYSDSDNSYYGTYVVGTVSGTSITYGTPTVYITQSTDGYADITYDTNANKVVIAWRGTSNYGRVLVGTVSGTSISFGSETIFASAITVDIVCGFDSSSNKVLICYADGGNSYYATAIVGTVSGTSISFGTEVQLASSRWNEIQIAFDTALNKFSAGYKDWGNSYYATAAVLTISGTSVSVGTSTVMVSANLNMPAIAYDVSEGKFAYFTTNSSNGIGIVFSISGTSIVVGNTTTFDAGLYPNTYGCVYDSAAQKILLAYVENSTGSRYMVATISGTTITFSSSTRFDTALIGNFPFGVAYDAASQATVVSYKGANSDLYSTVITTQGSTNADFVGITDEIISSGASGSVVVQGGVATKASATLPAVLSAGTAAVFEAATTNYISSAFDANSNKVVISYRDGGDADKGTAIVGTVSGTTISFGTPVVYSTDTSVNSTVFDSNSNKIVIAYRHNGNSNYGTAIVGTVSGTSISFGTPVVFETADSGSISATFDSNANKVVISYDDNGNSSYGTAIVGTVSGTSISFGTPVVFISSLVEGTSSAYDSTNNKTAIAFINASGHLGAIVATLSGTSLTFGSVATNSLASNFPCAVFDPVNNKIVIAYKQSVGTASVCTISGTSISLGTPVVFNNNNTGSISGAYNVDKSNIVFVSYQFGATGIAIVGTVSGTSISFGTAATFESGEIAFTSSVYDSVAKKTLAAYQDTPNSYYGTATVFTQSAGVLTIGTDYFVQTDGTISTTSSTVPAGRALSTTSMLLEG